MWTRAANLLGDEKPHGVKTSSPSWAIFRLVRPKMIWQLTTDSWLSPGETRTAYLNIGQFANLQNCELSKCLLFKPLSYSGWLWNKISLMISMSFFFILLRLKYWHLHSELLLSLIQCESILLYIFFFTWDNWSLLYCMFPPPPHFCRCADYCSLSILLKPKGMEMG